jgi:formylglycine-generating enzyme required for sulfatase activity
MIKRLIISTLVLFQFSILFSSSPFGTVKLNDSVYLDETEIDVGTWLSYYTWVLGHEDYESAKKILPDSSAVEPELWIYINKISTDYIDNFASYSLQPIGYFGKECLECNKFGKRLPTERRFCAMLDFPITGLSYEQVIGFCEWRTKVEGGNKFIFRLPTPYEWKEIALNGLSELERKNGFRDSMNNKNCAYYNYDVKCTCVNADIQGKLLGVGMYTPEKTGAFDLFGNVSEMTSVKGIAKGGNFKLFAIQCHPDSVQFYCKPEIWLGFRCIVIKKKKK